MVPGRGSGFSAEAPEGVRFLTRSRVFTDDEVAELEAAGPRPAPPDKRTQFTVDEFDEFAHRMLARARTGLCIPEISLRDGDD